MGYIFRLNNHVSSITNPDGSGLTAIEPCKVLWNETGRSYQIAPLGVAFKFEEVEGLYYNGTFIDPGNYGPGLEMAQAIQDILNPNSAKSYTSFAKVVPSLPVIGSGTVYSDQITNVLGSQSCSFIFILDSPETPNITVGIEIYNPDNDTYINAGTIALLNHSGVDSVSAIGVVSPTAVSGGAIIGLSMPMPTTYRFSVVESNNKDGILGIIANYF